VFHRFDLRFRAHFRAVEFAMSRTTDVLTQPPTVLKAPSPWRGINLRELWHCRELVLFLAWRDVLVRYQQTLLGAAWAILQPALMMVAFTLFFSHVAKVSSGHLPYALYAYAGLLPWTFFATAVNGAAQSVVGSERLISKVYFPRLAMPLAAVLAAAVDLGVGMILLIVLLGWDGVAPGATLLAAPLILAALALAAAGVGAALAALNVLYRDVRYVIGFALQIWMLATPAIYMLCPNGRAAAVNPLNALIAAFRASVTGGAVDFLQLAPALAGSAVLFGLGCLYFRKIEANFADVI
jgi:lipopolysaccharide transport system permease protein